MKVYLIGIGGIGMSGVAGILKESGFEVFGSEKDTLYSPSSEILKKLNILFYNPDPENIKKLKPDAVIVGNVAKKDDPEVIISQNLGIPLYSFPDFLSKFIFKNKKTIVCAGTHGKTTTTALLSYTLEAIGFDPTYLVGGVIKSSGLNFKKGNGSFAVVEGDEYPASFFDTQPKFLYYKPFSLILTSLEYDHADVYSDIFGLKEVFKKLIHLVPEDGVIVYNQDDENLREFVEDVSPKAKVISYGKSSQAQFALLESKTIFKNSSFINYVVADTPFQKSLKFSVSLPGEYNALNALSILTLLYGLNILKKGWKKAFKTFPGVKRRQEIVYADKNLVIIDDFAHHPTAVKKTLKELKSTIKPKKTIVVFEPRTNSSKRKIFQEDYVKSLSLADEVYVKIPPRWENIPENERLDINYLTESLKKKGLKASILKDEFECHIISEKGSLIIFMSSAYFKELDKIKNIIKNDYYFKKNCRR